MFIHYPVARCQKCYMHHGCLPAHIIKKHKKSQQEADVLALVAKASTVEKSVSSFDCDAGSDFILVLWNTETTEINTANARIAEIAIKIIQSGEEYHSYVRQERDIPASATAINSITREMTSNAPIFWEVTETMIRKVCCCPISSWQSCSPCTQRE